MGAPSGRSGLFASGAAVAVCVRASASSLVVEVGATGWSLSTLPAAKHLGSGSDGGGARAGKMALAERRQGREEAKPVWAMARMFSGFASTGVVARSPQPPIAVRSHVGGPSPHG